MQATTTSCGSSVDKKINPFEHRESDSPDFCRSSQSEMCSEKVITLTQATENTHSLNSSVRPSVRLRSTAFIISKEKSCPGLAK